MISDKYIHSKVEDKIYSYWEKNKLFKPQKNSKKFSIVIPVYNEGKNLGILIPKIYKELKKEKFELIIVDDNSTDNTATLIKKFKQ